MRFSDAAPSTRFSNYRIVFVMASNLLFSHHRQSNLFYFQLRCIQLWSSRVLRRYVRGTNATRPRDGSLPAFSRFCNIFTTMNPGFCQGTAFCPLAISNTGHDEVSYNAVLPPCHFALRCLQRTCNTTYLSSESSTPPLMTSSSFVSLSILVTGRFSSKLGFSFKMFMCYRVS